MTAAFKKRKVDTTRILRAAKESLSQVAQSTNQLVPGQVYDIPLKRIRHNPVNARAVYAAAAAEDLLRSFRDKGQTTAALGFLDQDGDVILIDGHRRLRACETLGYGSLRVELRPAPSSEQGLYLASRSANTEREGQTPLDDALVWKRLLERKVFANQAALARTLGLSESEVSRTLSLTELPGRLVQSVAEYPQLLNLKMLNALRELHRSQGLEKTQEVIHAAAREGLSYREVEARRKILESGPQARPRAARHELRFRGAKGTLRVFATAGRVELSFSGLKPADHQAVVQKLEKLFSTG